MKEGELKRVEINGIILKLRKESDGYYTYIPTSGSLICFNELGFIILNYISEGYNLDQVTQFIVDKYQANAVMMKKKIIEYYKYLESLQIPISLDN